MVIALIHENQKLNFQRRIFVAMVNIRLLDTRGVKFRHIMTDALAILGEEDRFQILS